MGTRNLTVVYSGGEYRLAKYCQWDGYPKGNGIDILRFLRVADLGHLRSCVENLEPVTEAYIKEHFLENDKVADEFSRNTGGAAILQLIAERGGGVKVYNELEFAADSLFCEWLWLIDFDAGTAGKFEAYRGFNETPLSPDDRFYFLRDKSDPPYCPVKLVCSWPLAGLPTDEEFLETFKQE